MNVWANNLANGNCELTIIQEIRRLILESLDRYSHNRKKPNIYSMKILSWFGNKHYFEKSKIRFFLTRLLPFDPVKESPSDISIVIFTSLKDIPILPLSIAGALASHNGNISTVTIVSPQGTSGAVQSIIHKFDMDNINYVSDEQLLHQSGLSSFKFIRVNIKMEILKIIAGINSESNFVLLLDGDTVLLRKRTWAGTNSYPLMVAQEYSASHVNYNKRVLNTTNFPGVGFVTHHQLVKKEILIQLVEYFGGIENLAHSFEETAAEFYLESKSEFPSEWQLIGDFHVLKDPSNYKYANFSNLGLAREKLAFLFLNDWDVNSLRDQMLYLEDKSPGLGSISFHSYKT